MLMLNEVMLRIVILEDTLMLGVVVMLCVIIMSLNIPSVA